MWKRENNDPILRMSTICSHPQIGKMRLTIPDETFHNFTAPKFVPFSTNQNFRVSNLLNILHFDILHNVTLAFYVFLNFPPYFLKMSFVSFYTFPASREVFPDPCSGNVWFDPGTNLGNPFPRDYNLQHEQGKNSRPNFSPFESLWICWLAFLNQVKLADWRAS